MRVEVRECVSDKLVHTFDDVSDGTTILEIKKKIYGECKKIPVIQQSLRSEPRGKSLNDNRCMQDLTNSAYPNCVHLYLRNLGRQVGWRTVFILEYAGPLVTYFSIWLLRQPYFKNPLFSPMKHDIELRNLFMLCYCAHFVKRLLETVFIHRFSHATMPFPNLFRNCSYYAGFAAFISYFTNHPLYTPPAFGNLQIGIGLTLFLIGEFANFSCHLRLKRLRPAGSTVRQIPGPMPGWYFTRLYKLVACANYTYEGLAWAGFTIMTQTVPSLLFTIVGFAQMSIWALQKLRAYRKEFPDFPRHRKAIIPFIL